MTGKRQGVSTILGALSALALVLDACTAPTPAPPPKPPPPKPMSAADLDAWLSAIYADSNANGMVVAVVRGDQVTVRGYGHMAPNDPRTPDGATLVRLESISKLLTSQVLITLADQGKLSTTDPLQRYAPAGETLPKPAKDRPITLVDLATHTSGLPRETELKKSPTAAAATAARWDWLRRQVNMPAPGTMAAYSNAGFDVLADALAVPAGEPYPAALHRLVTGPLGMADTTPSPTPEQCRRFLVADPDRPPFPCVDQAATAGSGGVYSTANDMGQWLKRMLAPDHGGVDGRAAQAIVYRREALTRAIGLDHAGLATGIGYAWMELAAQPGYPRMLEKTGGGDGFLTYIAIAPDQRVGVFIAVDKVHRRPSRAIVLGTNLLMGPLSGAQPVTPPPIPGPGVLAEAAQQAAEAQAAAEAAARRPHRRVRANGR